MHEACQSLAQVVRPVFSDSFPRAAAIRGGRVSLLRLKWRLKKHLCLILVRRRYRRSGRTTGHLDAGRWRVTALDP